ncbi:anion exchange transporter [Pseudophryne corroboree]|uniref:anion exchange transporter n=1 Tax=Pseudophryne corroboree TaxID=495146 RepID=UPI0030816EAF
MSASYKKNYFSLTWKRLSSIGYPEVRGWCLRRVPILEWGPRYSIRENLIPDSIAGMMLTVQQVAQGLAFAVMSSVHPVFGLYGSLFPPLIYAIFGMSHHVSTGTFAITSLISAGAVERLVPPNDGNVTQGLPGDLGLSEFEMQRIGVAAAVTFLGGVIQVSMFLLHLGFTTFLLSQPVVSAMTTGAATHVVTSQVKFLLGLQMPYISGPLGMFYIYIYVFKHLNLVNIGALLLSILSLCVLIVTTELNEKFKNKIRFVIPIDLALIITTAMACYFSDMHKAYDVDIVGHIPKGIPLPRAPSMDVIQHVVIEAFSMALVGYTVSICLAYNSAKKFNYSVCENQELFAHGLSNIIPSFFCCIPNAGAPGRTFLLYNNGAKTQVACVISCILVLMVIYFVAPLLCWLPMSVLASIVVVGLKGMLIQFRDLKKYWNVDKYDWVIWISTYVFTICFAANIGLLFGVVFSIAVGALRLTRAKTLSVVHLHDDYSTGFEDEHSKLFHELEVIAISTPLFFLNAKKLNTDILEIKRKLVSRKDSCKLNTGPLLIPMSAGDSGGLSQGLKNDRMTVILNCSGITFFDFTGINTLTQIVLDLREHGSDVIFSGCSASLVKALHYCDPGAKHQHFFTDVKSALDAMKIIKCTGSSLEVLDSSEA